MKPSQSVALKSFDKGGRVLWTIGRNQLYPSPDFRYDLRSIASDRRHLFVLDYSVGAVHMLTHGGTYLQRVVQHLDRPTHLCVDANRQRVDGGRKQKEDFSLSVRQERTGEQILTVFQYVVHGNAW